MSLNFPKDVHWVFNYHPRARRDFESRPPPSQPRCWRKDVATCERIEQQPTPRATCKLSPRAITSARALPFAGYKGRSSPRVHGDSRRLVDRRRAVWSNLRSIHLPLALPCPALPCRRRPFLHVRTRPNSETISPIATARVLPLARIRVA